MSENVESVGALVAQRAKRTAKELIAEYSAVVATGDGIENLIAVAYMRGFSSGVETCGAAAVEAINQAFGGAA